MPSCPSILSQLHRYGGSLSLLDTAPLMAANAVGAGIFTTSGILAGEPPGPRLFVGIWVIGGLLAVCGVFACVEMSGMFTRSGGDHIFLRASRGPWAGFLPGWINVWVIDPDSIAALSISIAEHLTGFFGSSGSLQLKDNRGARGSLFFSYELQGNSIREALM